MLFQEGACEYDIVSVAILRPRSKRTILQSRVQTVVYRWHCGSVGTINGSEGKVQCPHSLSRL